MAVYWQIIKILIQYLPVIIEAVKRGEKYIELKIVLKDFDKDSDKSKETKDTSGLENDFNPPSNPSPPAA